MLNYFHHHASSDRSLNPALSLRLHIGNGQEISLEICEGALFKRRAYDWLGPMFLYMNNQIKPTYMMLQVSVHYFRVLS